MLSRRAELPSKNVTRCLLALFLLHCWSDVKCAEVRPAVQTAHLFRSAIRDRVVQTVCGHTLAVPSHFPDPIRAWTGVIAHQFDANDLAEMQRRHGDWVKESLADPLISKEERAARRMRAFTPAPKFAEVTVLQFQTEKPGGFLCVVDTNADGRLNDESALTIVVQKADPLDQSLVLSLTLTSEDEAQLGSLEKIESEQLALPKYQPQKALEVPPACKEAYETLINLDFPATRKNHLPAVVDGADKVIQIIGQGNLRDAADMNLLLAECWYRRARAIGYMELPDVVGRAPIENQDWIDSEFERSFQQLKSLVDVHRPEYILLAVRRERRRSNFSIAQSLVDIYAESHPNPIWRFKKRRDLFREAGDDVRAHDASILFWLKSKAPPDPSCLVIRSSSLQRMRETVADHQVQLAAQRCGQGIWETVLWNTDCDAVLRLIRERATDTRYPVTGKEDARMVRVFELTLAE